MAFCIPKNYGRKIKKIKMMIKKFNIFNLLSTNEDLNDPNLNKLAKGRVRAALASTMSYYNFFADLFFQLTIAEASPNSGIDTMATDGKSILYSPKFVNEVLRNTEEVAFVLIHEVMHNANLHFLRQGDRDHSLWNQATDYAINIQIADMSKEKPEGAASVVNILSVPQNILLDEKYRGMSAEQIYVILETEEKNNPKKPKKGGDGGGPGGDGGGPGGDGGGPGGGPGGDEGGPGGDGGGSIPGKNDLREPGSLTDKKGPTLFEGNDELAKVEDVTDLAREWGKILNDAKSKNQGTGSATLNRWFNKIGKPKVNWKATLIKFMNKCFASNPKYGYFNKRFIGQDDPMYLPGLKFPKDSGFRKIVLCVDTSGSIGDDTLGKFAAEIYGIFGSKKIEEAIIIWCDADIKGIEKIDLKTKSGDSMNEGKFKEILAKHFKAIGGGGTSFIPPFQWIENNMIKKGTVPSFVIYFTDSHGVPPNKFKYQIPKYYDKILWVITEAQEAPDIQWPPDNKLFIDK